MKTTIYWIAMLLAAVGVISYAASPTLPSPITRTIGSTSSTLVISFPLGVRQTFNPSATSPGVNVGSVASDPSSLVNGDLWYASGSGRLRARSGGSSVDVANGNQYDVLIGTVTSASSIAVDLNGNQYQSCTLTHNATLSTANRPASGGRAVTVFFTASGGDRTLTLSGSWVNFSDSPTVVITSGKQAFITIMATGPAETDVRVITGKSL